MEKVIKQNVIFSDIVLYTYTQDKSPALKALFDQV